MSNSIHADLYEHIKNDLIVALVRRTGRIEMPISELGGVAGVKLLLKLSDDHKTIYLETEEINKTGVQ